MEIDRQRTDRALPKGAWVSLPWLLKTTETDNDLRNWQYGDPAGVVAFNEGKTGRR